MEIKDKQMKKTQLCSGEDCYKEINLDPLFLVIRLDGTIHPLSLKCEDCLTDAEHKTLKNSAKKIRHRRNQLLKV